VNATGECRNSLQLDTSGRRGPSNYENDSKGESLDCSHTHPLRSNFPKSSETLKTLDIAIRRGSARDSCDDKRKVVALTGHVRALIRLPPTIHNTPLGSQAPRSPPRRRTTHCMGWLLRWPEIFLAVLVAALEAYRFGSTTTPMVSHAAWTPQRKLEMR